MVNYQNLDNITSRAMESIILFREICNSIQIQSFLFLIFTNWKIFEKKYHAKNIKKTYHGYNGILPYKENNQIR